MNEIKWVKVRGEYLFDGAYDDCIGYKGYAVVEKEGRRIKIEYRRKEEIESGVISEDGEEIGSWWESSYLYDLEDEGWKRRGMLREVFGEDGEKIFAEVVEEIEIAAKESDF